MRTSFSPEGRIRGTDLLAAIVSLWREAASGSLQFSRSGATAGFDFASGEIVGASSSDPRFDTAAILVRAGKLEASTLERITASESADRATTALQAGVLTKREWRWGEKIRAVEVLSDLLTWIEGDYTLYRSPPREAGEFRLTIPRLVLELFLRSRDRGLVLHHLGGVDVPLVRDSRFDEEFATFGLTDDAESVVRLIDGKSTAAEIASEAPADAFAVEKLLAALVTLGLVHPAYTAAESDSAAAGARPTFRVEAAPEQSEAAGAGGEEESEQEQKMRGEEEEELEPEVDIEEKVSPDPEDLPAEEPAAEEPIASAAAELEVESPLAEASLEVMAVPEDSESEAERFAADFEPGRPSPADLMAPESAELQEASAFDRPLDRTTGIGAAERPEHRSTSPLVWLLVLLAALTGGILYWRAHGGAGASASVAAAVTPSPTQVEAPAAAPAVAPSPPSPAATARSTPFPPTAVPTRIAPAAAPARRSTAAPATPSPSATAAAKTAPPPAPAAGSRSQWLDRAERDRKRTAADGNARFTIQLELACELPSLTEAWAHDRPAGTMWTATTSFRGKTCFRVLWGRYPTREAAERARAAAPTFFSTARNHPMVVPIR